VLVPGSLRRVRESCLTDISIYEHSFRPLPSFGIAVGRHPRVRTRGNHANIVGIRRAGVGAGDLVDRVDVRDLFADVELAKGRLAV
jgi:hypothetical protein